METKVEDKILITVREACALTGIGIHAMYAMVNRKGCPVVNIGLRKKLIVKEKFVEWLSNGAN